MQRSCRRVQVWTVVQGMHLVDADVAQTITVPLDCVEHSDRFTIGEGDDDVTVRRDVVEHRLGWHRFQLVTETNLGRHA